MVVYRLGSGRYSANDGWGASLYGGRWNHKGTPVIYAAASRALCALEILANADELAGDYIIVPIEVPDDVAVQTVYVESLPSNWNAGQSIAETVDLGTNWAKSGTTAVLVVPSAVVPRERNYILNPGHPDFGKIRFLSSEPFSFDQRLRRAKLNE